MRRALEHLGSGSGASNQKLARIRCRNLGGYRGRERHWHLDAYYLRHQDVLDQFMDLQRPMCTNISLEDDLAAILSSKARHSGRSFKQVVNAAIRRGLALGEPRRRLANRNLWCIPRPAA